MSFGWSAGDVVLAIRGLNQIRIALRDSGAATDYREEVAFLGLLSTTLESLHDIGAQERQEPSRSSSPATETARYADQLKKSIDSFLHDAQKQFEKALGSPTSSRINLVVTARKIQWAFSTSEKVKQLRAKISEPLGVMQIAMSRQIM